MKRNLRIFKFGGTSVGDARRISKAVDIVCDAAKESRVVVVVSAMEGVTNTLVQAASCAITSNKRRADPPVEGPIYSGCSVSCHMVLRISNSEPSRAMSATEGREISGGVMKRCVSPPPMSTYANATRPL